MTSTGNRMIYAPAEKIYAALTTVEALETWQAPHNMTGKVHYMDLREGGSYSMSLYYPDNERKLTGKTSPNEDRFTVSFEKLVINKKIIQAVEFDTSDDQYKGRMMMEITLEEKNGGTEVVFNYGNLPAGISPADNDAGTASSLEKLAAFVE